jgi:hypothetical protein
VAKRHKRARVLNRHPHKAPRSACVRIERQPGSDEFALLQRSRQEEAEDMPEQPSPKRARSSPPSTTAAGAGSGSGAAVVAAPADESKRTVVIDLTSRCFPKSSADAIAAAQVAACGSEGAAIECPWCDRVFEGEDKCLELVDHLSYSHGCAMPDSLCDHMGHPDVYRHECSAGVLAPFKC